MTYITNIGHQLLGSRTKEILAILKNITELEENDNSNPLKDDPVLIGSRAAKWHVPSFREPDDWDLVATISQATLFINKVKPNASFKDIKLFYYPGSGLKIICQCVELHTDKISANFDIELVSDKVDLSKIMIRNEGSNKGEDNMDIDNNNEEDDDEIKDDDDSFEFGIDDIKFEKFSEGSPKMSAQMILELCRDVKDKTLFPLSGFPCIVAPLKVLEALKSSHIYWPANFHKNIADLHSLRVLSGYDQNLQRDEQIELMLKTRIKETEIRQGVPGAHINLMKSNEEFLDREDDLFVQRRISHDELHERVKYGDRPIYETLKEDKSKAWINRSLFRQMDYQTQLNCVKEEAMVIALERYLIPMISKNQETSYQSALVRICTTLTKGWFRRFAIDNYPLLSKLDKDLLLISQDIIKNHPLQQEKPKAWKLDPETRAIFDPINPYTKVISSFDELDDPRSDLTAKRSGFKITSPVNGISITAVVTSLCFHEVGDCNPSASWSASVVIMPSEDLEILSNENASDRSSDYYDPLCLHPYDHNDYHNNLKLTSKHIFTIKIEASSNGSWGVGEDVWNSMIVCAKSADYIADKLEIPGFTGDLLFKYVLAYLEPTLQNNGETPLKHRIDALKVNGTIPIKPQQHLWYDAWNYTLSRGGKWNKKKKGNNF